MRSLKGLFMLLIGMISFTAMASTPLTEQKQKIEIVKDFQVQTIADNVLSFELIEPAAIAVDNYLKEKGSLPYSYESTNRVRYTVVGFYQGEGCPRGVGLYHVVGSDGSSYEIMHHGIGNNDVYPGGSIVPKPKC